MPGPVSRGDVAMTQLGEPLLSSYRLPCDRTVPLALARGGIDAATAERLRRILGTPNESERAP